MSNLQQFPNFQARTNLRATQLQQISDRLDQLTPLSGSGSVVAAEEGIIHGVDDPYGLPEWWWAEIVAPDSASYIFNDPRYRVRPLFIRGGGMNNAIDVDFDPPISQLSIDENGNRVLVPPRQYTATNMAEMKDGTHNLRVGDKVLVTRELDRGNPPQWHYVFYGAISSETVYPVKIVSVCDRLGGGYFVQAYISPIGITGIQDGTFCLESVGQPLRALNLPEGMPEQTTYEDTSIVPFVPLTMLALNTKEHGFKTHWAAMNTWAFGVIRFNSVNEPVFILDSVYAKDTGGPVLASGLASDFNIIQPSDIWSRNQIEAAAGDPNQHGNGPVFLWQLTRMHNYPGSPGNCKDDPPKLIIGMRGFQYTADGAVSQIGLESTIEIPGCCPDGSNLSSASFATASEASTSRALATMVRSANTIA